MPFNCASLDDWKTKPGQNHFLDVFLSQGDLDIRNGKLVRTRYKAKKPVKNGSTSTPPPTVTWTPVEDAAILGMKARSKTFPEMSKVMAGKSEHAIRERYKELYVDVPKEFKQKAKDTDKDEVKAAEEEKKEKEPAEEDKKESPKDALIDIKETEKGKDAEVTLDQDVRKVNGKPVIYVVDGGKDGLSATELGMLYVMNAHFEEKKWTAMASKFFDKTGKRVNPDALRGQLQNGVKNMRIF